MNYELDICKGTKRELVFGGELTHYKKQKLKVPLCAKCHSRISTEESIKAIIMLLGLVGSFVYGYILTGVWYSALLAGITLGGLVLLALNVMLKFLLKGEIRLRVAKPVKNLIDQGWSLGSRP